ncbi:hypothetical protein GCM10023340_04010 [Nocardioides marinquilinus]|uniref:Uncharacterized protein n=1 Tax=Nocardioides marinquilinus TaxID=1210400 RepID=A0ABP9P736_9ACTN
MGLYRELGGANEQPTLRPGAWDLCAGGTVIELDEELHFNRYRAATLEGEWAAALPWCDDYRELCGVREPECLRAATWGKRWANPSSDRLFGGSSPPGDLDGGLGASRWKQRALYDAFKDVVALTTDLRLARLSVWDDVGGRTLGEMLEGRAEVDPAEVVALVVRRAV